MIGWPLYRLVKNIHQRGRLPDMKPVRVRITAAVAVALLASLLLIPFPMSIKATTVIQPHPAHRAAWWWLTRAISSPSSSSRTESTSSRSAVGAVRKRRFDRQPGGDAQTDSLVKKQIQGQIQQQQSSGNKTGPIASQLVKAQVNSTSSNRTRQLLREQQERLVLSPAARRGGDAAHSQGATWQPGSARHGSLRRRRHIQAAGRLHG